jgi:DNA-3-methyladenine glycosylase II
MKSVKETKFNQSSYIIEPVPPFRLDLTVWALRRRPDNIIDQWDGQTYRRALWIDGQVIGMKVKQIGDSKHPQLSVATTGQLLESQIKPLTLPVVQKLLGTEIDLTAFYRFADRNKALKELITQFQGVKPPRFPTMFEALVNSISCQQISLNICIRLLNRMAEKWGPGISLPEGVLHLFPNPDHLQGIEPDEFRKLGYSYNKARAILELVDLIRAGELNLEAIAKLDDTEAISNLMQLRGVGHWTAEYTLLRGDGRTHIFPPGDSGALHNLQNWLAGEKPADGPTIKSILESWSPFAGLVYFHLLLRRLNEMGYLDEATKRGNQ